jgi:hypothetical protein
MLLAICSLCCVASIAHAQELYALAGAQRTAGVDDSSYAFSLAYQHNVAEHALLSFTWLNEGHVAEHHRDGFGLQGWLRWLNAARTFDATVGVGPYRFYDTTLHSVGTNSVNEHGFGVLYSVAAHWYTYAPLILQVRYNRAETSTSISTDTLLFGVGYQFEPGNGPGPSVPPRSYGFFSPERNEVTLMLGSTTLNDFSSPKGTAGVLEYRRNLTPYIDATATVIDEGEAGDVKRRGVAVQLWAGRRFLDQRAMVGLGAGPYVAWDDDVATRSLGLLTMSISYDFTRQWHGRASWYRTVTTNSRDTDIIVAGIGRLF